MLEPQKKQGDGALFQKETVKQIHNPFIGYWNHRKSRGMGRHFKKKQ